MVCLLISGLTLQCWSSPYDLYKTTVDISGRKGPIEFRPVRPGHIVHNRLGNSREMETLDGELRADLRDGLE